MTTPARLRSYPTLKGVALEKATACVQGGGEGHEAQLALVEITGIRQSIASYDGCPSRGQRDICKSAVSVEYEASRPAATREWGCDPMFDAWSQVPLAADPQPSLIPWVPPKTMLVAIESDPAHLEASVCARSRTASLRRVPREG